MQGQLAHYYANHIYNNKDVNLCHGQIPHQVNCIVLPLYNLGNELFFRHRSSPTLTTHRKKLYVSAVNFLFEKSYRSLIPFSPALKLVFSCTSFYRRTTLRFTVLVREGGRKEKKKNMSFTRWRWEVINQLVSRLEF